MIVEITNLTDGPDKTPQQIAIYSKTIDPGESIRIDASLIDKRVRKLEEAGLIAIGSIPPWYATAKIKSRTLSQEELLEVLIDKVPPPVEHTPKNGERKKQDRR